MGKANLPLIKEESRGSPEQQNTLKEHRTSDSTTHLQRRQISTWDSAVAAWVGRARLCSALLVVPWLAFKSRPSTCVRGGPVRLDPASLQLTWMSFLFPISAVTLAGFHALAPWHFRVTT